MANRQIPCLNDGRGNDDRGSWHRDWHNDRGRGRAASSSGGSHREAHEHSDRHMSRTMSRSRSRDKDTGFVGGTTQPHSSGHSSGGYQGNGDYDRQDHQIHHQQQQEPHAAPRRNGNSGSSGGGAWQRGQAEKRQRSDAGEEAGQKELLVLPGCVVGRAPQTTGDNFRRQLAASFSVESNVEDDEHRLEQRLKQVGYGKNTVAYDRYTAAVPRDQRQGYDVHPRTPDVHEKVSKRLFAGRVKAWRRRLHQWDEPLPDPAPAPALSDNTTFVASAELSAPELQRQLTDKEEEEEEEEGEKEGHPRGDRDEQARRGGADVLVCGRGSILDDIYSGGGYDDFNEDDAEMEVMLQVGSGSDDEEDDDVL